jgi:ribonuclease P protein component
VLAAGQRLRRSSDFAAAIRGGRRAGRGAVVVHLTEPSNQHPAGRTPDASCTCPARHPPETHNPGALTRAGFVVSKAVGGAVVRNAVRRRLRHLVRDRLPQLSPGATLVVRALPGAGAASYTQLRLDLDGALATARARRARRADRGTA